MLHRLRLGRISLICASVFLVAPTAALADGLPAFIVGPVSVGHGYTVAASGFGCDTQFVGGNITFTKAGHGWTESHTWGATSKASCHLAKNLSSGSMKFSVGNMATIDITFSKRGSKKRAPLPPGCTGTHPQNQGGVAKGKFKIEIDPKFFGSVSKHRVPASASTSPNFRCKSTRAERRSYFLSVVKGTEATNLSVDATLAPHGVASVSFFQSNSSPKGFTSHSLTVTGGSSLFSAMPDLSSAKVNGAGKIRGHLKFKATGSCKSHSRAGTISGSLTADFDVIGHQTIKPSTTPAPFASLGRQASC